MAHYLAQRSAYQRLTDRLNRCPQGAPPSDSLFAILKILFSEREAALVAALPIRPLAFPSPAAQKHAGICDRAHKFAVSGVATRRGPHSCATQQGGNRRGVDLDPNP